MKIRNMHYYVLTALLLLGLAGMAMAPNQQADDHEMLDIGQTAPMADVSMKTIDGEMTSLMDAKRDKGLLVIFTSNTCPYVKAWEDRYLEVANLAKENDIGVIALNSNTRTRDRGESMEDMKKRAKKLNYNFTYAKDKNHKLADAFGATHTPHIYLFNSDMELVYRGAIDDNYENADAVEKPYLKNALKSLAEGEEIANKTTVSLGCSIKRVSS